MGAGLGRRLSFVDQRDPVDPEFSRGLVFSSWRTFPGHSARVRTSSVPRCHARSTSASFFIAAATEARKPLDRTGDRSTALVHSLRVRSCLAALWVVSFAACADEATTPLVSCVPACGDRVCGVDPVCGVSCGTCSGSEASCSPEGQCVSISFIAAECASVRDPNQGRTAHEAETQRRVRRGLDLLTAKRAIGAAALLAALGCSGVTEDRWVPSPWSSDARTAILAIATADTLTVEAHDLERDTVLRPRTPLDPSATLELLGYDRPLIALGLEEGTLTADEDGEPLPSPTTIHTYALDGESWVPTDTPSDAMASFRTPRTARGPCEDLSVETVYLPTEAAPIAVVSESEDELWIVTHVPGEALVYDGATVRHASITPALEYTEVARAPDGDFLAVSRYPGALYRGRPNGLDLTLEIVTSSVGPTDTSRITTTPDDRVYLITKLGQIVEAGATSPWFEFVQIERTDNTGIVASGGALYGVSEHSAEIVRLVEGVAPQFLGIPSISGGIELVDLPGYGLVLGTVHSEVFRIDGDDVVLLGVLELNKARAIVPWGEELLIGGNNGGVALLLRDGRTCTIGRQITEHHTVGARVGDAAVFFPTSVAEREFLGGQTPMTVVTGLPSK